MTSDILYVPLPYLAELTMTQFLSSYNKIRFVNFPRACLYLLVYVSFCVMVISLLETKNCCISYMQKQIDESLG